MLAKRWERIEQLFNEALEIPFDERNAFVEKACGADADLRTEVLSLLDADKDSDEILERSVYPLASRLIDSDSAKLRQFKKTLDAEINRLPHRKPLRFSLTNYFAEKWQHQKVFCTGVVLLVFLISGITFQYLNSQQSSRREIQTAQHQPIKSLAVLPFMNGSENVENDYLSDGITESVINRLGKLPELCVKARNSVFQFKGKDFNPQSASKELSVEALLVGRINEYGDTLTITLELIDGVTGNKIWSNKYNRTVSNLISLQNEIIRDVSNKLQTKISDTEKANLAKSYTDNAEAYELYLKGRYHWNKRTAADLQKSTEYFNRAIALDPNFALAFSGLAESYVLFSGYGAATPQNSFPKAKESAQRALEIDETLAEAHAALGYVLFNYEWNFASAGAES
jgi:TolB-like protein